MSSALHNYHDTHKVFPPGFVDSNPDHTDGVAQGITGNLNGLAWSTFILPYIEQGPLYDEVRSQTDGFARNWERNMSDASDPIRRGPTGPLCVQLPLGHHEAHQ